MLVPCYGKIAHCYGDGRRIFIVACYEADSEHKFICWVVNDCSFGGDRVDEGLDVEFYVLIAEDIVGDADEDGY